MPEPIRNTEPRPRTRRHRDKLVPFRDSRGGDPVSGADLFGLIVSTLVCIYLVYALVRGERL